MTIYGVNKPAVQTAEGIKRWLNREGLQPQILAWVSPDAFMDIYQPYKTGLLIFSGDELFLPYGYCKGKFCPLDLPEILATSKPSPRLQLPRAAYRSLFAGIALNAVQVPGWSMQQLSGGLRTLWGEAIPFTRLKVDYMIFVPFAISVGSRFRTKDMRPCVKAAREIGTPSFLSGARISTSRLGGERMER